MKIYNKDKTEILINPDLKLGYLEQDKISVPEVIAVEGKGHYETITEYPNGGKDVKWVVDIPEVKGIPEHDEEILVYIPFTEEELRQNKLNELRAIRESECFLIINRGELWYDMLTEKQKEELNVWYQAWLHITDNVTASTDTEKIIPEKPSWLK